MPEIYYDEEGMPVIAEPVYAPLVAPRLRSMSTASWRSQGTSRAMAAEAG
jgi:hypothetical protein